MEVDVRAGEVTASVGLGRRIPGTPLGPCCREDGVCLSPSSFHSLTQYLFSIYFQPGWSGCLENTLGGRRGGWPFIFNEVDWVDLSLEGDIEANT